MTDTDDDAVELAQRLLDWAREGEAERLGSYVDAGVPVDLTDAKGNTLVMLAAYHGHAAAVVALAARGADVDRVNDRGQTPLAGAVFKGEDAVVDALLSAGADPGLGSPSAIETATFFGKDELAQRLARCAVAGPSGAGDTVSHLDSDACQPPRITTSSSSGPASAAASRRCG